MRINSTISSSRVASILIASFLFVVTTSEQALPQPRADQDAQDRPALGAGTKADKAATLRGETGSTTPASLPFRIEIGEGISSPDTEVILAVKAVTVFHCPEPPMQVLIGDSTGLGLVESIEGHNRNDFYLRPMRSGIRTNMWIEMPSATVHVGLRTITVKGGAGTGEYNSEVFVHLPGFRERVESIRARAAEIERELNRCLALQELLKQQSEEEKRRAIAETEAMLTDEALAAFAIASFASRKDIKPIRLGAASVKQIGGAVRIGTRRWWAVLEIENRDKVRPLWVQEISAPEGSRVRTREGRMPRIDPRKRTRFAVLIDCDPSARSDRGVLPPKLSLTIEGYSGEITLLP